MAVELHFHNLDGTELSTDKSTGGYNFGVTRKGKEVVIPVMIKNKGVDEAKNVVVQASTLHSDTEVTSNEYADETLAKSWQTFSLYPNKNFSSSLTLPNIKAGTFMVGVKELTDNLVDASTSAWSTVNNIGSKYTWTGSGLEYTDGTDGDTKFFSRCDALGWGDNKEIDFTYTAYLPTNSATGTVFIMVGLRQNCLGDDKGYLVNMKRSANASTVYFEIRKGAGIKNGTYDYGTTLITSNTVAYSDYAPIRIKLFTNASGLPEIKVWTVNVNDADTPVTWNGNQSWVDTANTYKYAGKVTMNIGSAGGTNVTSTNKIVITSTKLVTEDVNGKVYIKTKIGDGSVDGKVYKSAMEVFYDPI